MTVPNRSIPAAGLAPGVLPLIMWALSQAAGAAVIPGPTTVELIVYGDLGGGFIRQIGQMDQDDAAAGAEHITLTRSVGTTLSGEAYGSAGAFLSASPFAASARSPNHFPSATSEYIGALSVVHVFKSFRKDEAVSSLSFTFTDLAWQLGWEKEFGIKCLAGNERCQQAGFNHEVKVWDATGDEPVWRSLNAVTVTSQGTSTADPGYLIELGGDTRFAPIGGTITRTGADISLLYPWVFDVDLSGIGDNDLFTVEFKLQVWAYDNGAHLGPGRYAFLRSWDPLDIENAGPQIATTGLTPWAAAVPEPGTVPLMGFGLALLAFTTLRQRSRRRR